MIVLSIDAGRTSGIAVGDINQDYPTFFDLHSPLMGGEVARFWQFDASLKEIIEEFAPERIVLEAPLRVEAMHEDAAARQQLGLRGIVLSRAGHAQVAFSEISPDIVRKELLGYSYIPGKRGAIKGHVKHWCRRRGLKVPSDNAADAVLQWCWEKLRLTGRLPQQLRLVEVA